jgi:hypothetical protein
MPVITRAMPVGADLKLSSASVRSFRIRAGQLAHSSEEVEPQPSRTSALGEWRTLQ